MDIIAFVGFAVFFILGFLAGQSRKWYAIRKTWKSEIRQHDEDME